MAAAESFAGQELRQAERGDTCSHWFSLVFACPVYVCNMTNNNNSNKYVDTYLESNSAVDPGPFLLRLTMGYLLLLVLMLYPLTMLVRKLRKERKLKSASNQKLLDQRHDEDNIGVIDRMITMAITMIASWTKMKRIVAKAVSRVRGVARKMSNRVIRPIRLRACACTPTPESFDSRSALMTGNGHTKNAACSDAIIPSRFTRYQYTCSRAFAVHRGYARRKNYGANWFAGHSAIRSRDQPATAPYCAYSKDDDDITCPAEDDEMADHGAYDGVDWTDLPNYIGNAAAILGYCETSWDGGHKVETVLKKWDQLTVDEMAAATKLGFNEQFWNKLNDSDNQKEDIDTDQLNASIRGRDTLSAVLRFDKESQAIVQIALPTTVETMIGAILNAVQVAFISKYLGNNVLAVYGIVELALSLTEIVGSGIGAAEEVMVAHSIGACDYYRAGSVAQLSVCLYMLLAIPVYSFLIYFIDDFALYLDLGDEVARLAQAYVPVMALHHLIQDSFSDTLGILMRNYGKVWQMSLIDTAFSVFQVIGIVVGIVKFDCGLVEVAWIEVASSLIYGVFMYSFCACMGWFKPFQGGLFDMKGIQNDILIDEMIRTSIPLCMSELLASGEWQLFTLYAARIGYVATWTITGAIWELFEQSSEGISTAAVIRIGHYLGSGNPAKAKVVAYKALLACLIWSLILTAIFMWHSDMIIALFTDNEHIANTLKSVVVLVGASNCAMCMGNLAWAILSAQSRAHVPAWAYGGVGIVMISIPLGSFFTFKMDSGITGLVSAIIISYATVSTILLVFVFTSSWTKISCKIISACSGVAFVSVGEEEGQRRWHPATDGNNPTIVA